MKPGKSYGYCRVLYQAKNLQLKISVKGQSLKNSDQLILLNEVPGIGFSRLINRTEYPGRQQFSPWQPCAAETAVENPGLHIGFFLSLPDHPDPPCSQIAAGREVGRDLKWAGLSLAADQSVFTYHIHFYKRKSEGLEK